MNEIPAAVTLYWQGERIKELEILCDRLQHDVERMGEALTGMATEKERLREVVVTRDIERRQLQALLAACQKALREMQAQRDKAREGKR